MEGPGLMVFELQREILLLYLSRNPTTYEGLMKKLVNTNSLDEMFSAVWELDEAHQFMTPTLIESGKSEEEANRMRSDGNVYYKKKNFVKALQLYNLSIMNALHPVLPDVSTSLEDGSSESDCFVIPQISPARYGGTTGEHKALAMSYANRSAIMFELGLYENCLSDINLAFEYGYPADLREKLENRKGKCQSMLKEDTASVPSKNAKKPCSGAADENSENQYSFDPKALLEELQPFKVQEMPTLIDLLSVAKQKLNRVYEQNPDVPSLSNAIKIADVPRKGRGIIAVRDIRPGEVLGIERAYAIEVADDMLSSFCCTCVSLCLTPLPCPSCSKVIFCSKSCRKKGLAEDHWIECKILPTLMCVKLGDTRYGYKLLKTFSHEGMSMILKNVQNQKHNNSLATGKDVADIYDSTSYHSIVSLSTYKEKYSFEQLLDINLVAMVITKLLHQSGRYFVNQSGEPVKATKQDLLQTGTLLVSHTMKIDTNGFNSKTSKDTIGQYLLPSMSLLNHSCNPSAILIKSGRERALRAIRPISAGEEVTIAYTGNAGAYSSKEKEERTQHIKEMYFQCSCVACRKDWPVYERLPHVRGTCLVCKRCDVTTCFLCSSCFSKSMGSHRTKTFSTAIKSWDRACAIIGKAAAGEEISTDDFQFLCEYTEVLYNHLKEPCQIFHNISFTLEKCFIAGM